MKRIKLILSSLDLPAGWSGRPLVKGAGTMDRFEMRNLDGGLGDETIVNDEVSFEKVPEQNVRRFKDTKYSDRFGYVPLEEQGYDSSLEPLLSKLDIANASPSGRVELPKFEENPYYKQAVRYAEPNLTNEDLYPGLHDSVVVGNASNKTLGSFPIFGSGFAQVLPNVMIASKKKKAIMDYILDMEKIKASTAKPEKYPTTTPVEGDASWDAAINNVMTGMYSSYGQRGQAQYGSIAQSDNPAHPGYKEFNQISNFAKGAALTTKAIATKVKEAEALNLSPNNAIGKQTYNAIQAWNQYSSLPVEQKEHLLKFGDGVNFKNGSEFMTFLHKIGATIDADASIFGLSSPIINDIKKKAESYVSVHPNETYDSFITNKLESEYPIGKNEKGELVMSKEPYIKKLARDIAGNKKELFQDYDEKNPNPDAPYKLEDIEKHIENMLGYERLQTIYTARNAGANAGAASNQISATPQWLYSSLDKVAKGTAVDIGKDNSIIPGNNGVLFRRNGVLTAIPYTHKTELVDAMLETGAKDPTQFGAISSSEAQVNARGDSNLWNMVGTKVDATRKFPDISKMNTVAKFNNTAYALAGKNGFPISDDINIKKMMPIGASGESFYFNARIKGKNADESGVVLPENYIQGQTSKPWFFNLLSSNEKSTVSVDGSTMFMSGTYYKKEIDDATKVPYYSVYDKETNKPFKLVDKSSGESSEIRLREDQVQKIVSSPVDVYNEMITQYPETAKNEKPNESTYTNPNTATKTSKGQSAGTVIQKPTSTLDAIPDSILVTAHFAANGGAKGVADINEGLTKMQALLTLTGNSQTDAKNRDTFNKMYALAKKKFDYAGVKSLYK